jgi:hypothetical protein
LVIGPAFLPQLQGEFSASESAPAIDPFQILVKSSCRTPYSFRQEQYVCTVISASLQTRGVVFPLAISTCICRSKFFNRLAAGMASDVHCVKRGMGRATRRKSNRWGADE